jgi:outer membrane lipoprotein-sorting protein
MGFDRSWRWAVPVVVSGIVAAVVVVPGIASGAGHPTLPTRSAQQLLADATTAKPQAMTGTVVETTRLGLPELPSDGRTASSLNWSNFLTGSHKMQIWLGGPQHQRFALLGQLSESDIIHSGNDVWIYQSATNAVTHYGLGPAIASTSKAMTGGSPYQQVAPPMPDPMTVASRILRSLDPTTAVSVDATEWVAGRPAYQLVLTPRVPGTLVTRVSIAIDSATHLPLRVQMFGRSTKAPAFETSFTWVRFTAPAASVFAFRSPRGSALTEGKLPLQATGSSGASAGPVGTTGPVGGRGTKIVGSGWTSVLVAAGVTLPSTTKSGSTGGLLDLVDRASTRVAGGRLISTTLLTILLTDDGRLLLGPVTPAALERIAAGGTAA